MAAKRVDAKIKHFQLEDGWVALDVPRNYSEAMRHRRAPLARQWQLLVLDRRNFFRQLKPAHDKAHARCRGSAAEVDRFDARMRHRTAHECDMQHSGQREIGDVLALAAQQALVLAPRNRLPDKTFSRFRAHVPSVLVA